MNTVNNKVVLSGFAGANAEMKNLIKNKVANVSIAIHDNYKNKMGEEVKNTQWVNLTFWNQKAEQAATEIKKGTLFSVEGKLLIKSYQTKEGETRYTTEVVVSEFQVLPKKEMVAAN